MNRSSILGILVAAVAMFVWGMIYWAANPLPYGTWKKTTGDEAAGQALKQHFPENGTYYVPGLYNDDATAERLHNAGPVAFVHMLARDGRPRMEPMIMVKGFLLYVVVAALLLLVLRAAGPPAVYADRVKLAVAVAAVAAVMIHIGDTVWWYMPVNWKLHQALYDFLALSIGGAVLGRFRF